MIEFSFIPKQFFAKQIFTLKLKRKEWRHQDKKIVRVPGNEINSEFSTVSISSFYLLFFEFLFSYVRVIKNVWNESSLLVLRVLNPRLLTSYMFEIQSSQLCANFDSNRNRTGPCDLVSMKITREMNKMNGNECY